MAIAPALLARWPLADKAVGALVVFWLLHTPGGMLGPARNGYDRRVHLAFGLLWVLPFAEAMRRHAGMRRRGGVWMVFLFVGAASAWYGIFEWLHHRRRPGVGRRLRWPAGRYLGCATT